MKRRKTLSQTISVSERSVSKMQILPLPPRLATPFLRNHLRTSFNYSRSAKEKNTGVKLFSDTGMKHWSGIKVKHWNKTGVRLGSKNGVKLE